MSLMDRNIVVQASQSMLAVVETVCSWIEGSQRICILVAAIGAGKSHLLGVAAQQVQDALVMPAFDSGDCAEFIAVLKSGSKRFVIADDLDKFSKALREAVISLAVERGHSLLASMTDMSSRTKKVLGAKCPKAALLCLDDVSSRPEDVEAFVEHWIKLNALECDAMAVQECAKFCCSSRLPEGFRTIEKFLGSLLQKGWQFSGSLLVGDAASAFSEATRPSPTLPTILVEGYTDRLYLMWLLEGLPTPLSVEVRNCDGASRVAEQAIMLRNQSRPCVAVLDSDKIGLEYRDQLKKFGHPVVWVPVKAVDLPQSAYDHVLQVAEIEDLLPAAVIEQFLSSRQRMAELEIRAPTGVRYVIGESDKGDLARWVVEETDRDSAPKLVAFFQDVLSTLKSQ